MSIIPVSSSQRFEYVQEDGSKLFFRYLTGESRLAFGKIQEGLRPLALEFMDQAKSGLIASGISEPTDRQIAARMIESAKAAGRITPEDEDKQAALMVDTFLCGWEGPGFPVIEEGKKPSDYLGILAIDGVTNVITENLNVLLGLSVIDKKN